MMEIIFESRRLYVAARKSVLFFARVGEHRVRCYIDEDALAGEPAALLHEPDVYQWSLAAFDCNRELIQAAARRVILERGDKLDAAVVMRAATLQRNSKSLLAASDRATDERCGLQA